MNIKNIVICLYSAYHCNDGMLTQKNGDAGERERERERRMLCYRTKAEDLQRWSEMSGRSSVLYRHGGNARPPFAPYPHKRRRDHHSFSDLLLLALQSVSVTRVLDHLLSDKA